MIDRQRLADQLVIHECLRLFPYTDSVGKLTIGVGRNLSDVGLSRAEAFELLSNDIDKAERAAVALPWYAALDQVRQNAVVELIFNMGAQQFPARWKATPEALARGNYALAANLLRASKWFSQVGQIRGERICRMIETGKWPA